jgi:septal ring factor EnvC (AmiA/AmiB activator)
MDWQISMGFAFLVFISVVLWGASQGFYSKKVKLRPEASSAPPKELCTEYKLEIERLKGKIFEQSTELDAKNAKLAELTRNVNELMDAINSLTTKLQAAEATNARMAASLKNALEDLDKRSRQLQECNAKLLARQIVNEKCHMTPETANLLR